jgi:hypothetical protein
MDGIRRITATTTATTAAMIKRTGFAGKFTNITLESSGSKSRTSTPSLFLGVISV